MKNYADTDSMKGAVHMGNPNETFQPYMTRKLEEQIRGLKEQIKLLETELSFYKQYYYDAQCEKIITLKIINGK